jgi:hypothetical protein
MPQHAHAVAARYPGIDHSDVFANIPVLPAEDGEIALTDDPDTALRAVDAYLRHECGESLHEYHRGHVPTPHPMHLRYGPDAPGGPWWDVCEPGEPGAVPALYIGH